MKKILAILLLAGLLFCGCQNGNTRPTKPAKKPIQTTNPTESIGATEASIQDTTQQTTAPVEETTEPTGAVTTEPTVELPTEPVLHRRSRCICWTKQFSMIVDIPSITTMKTITLFNTKFSPLKMI